MKLLRINSWWNTIVPQVLGWIYFSLLTMIVVDAQSNLYTDVCIKICEFRSAWFLPALIGIAAFGYLFNDLCDVETDTKAGKPNALARMALTYRIIIVTIPLIIGVAAWVTLNIVGQFVLLLVSISANIFFALQILALMAYSLKPFRMKERAEWGVIFDAFYGHLNPVLITLSLFSFYPYKGKWHFMIMLLLIMVCSLKGIRNILLHQIEDRKQDNVSKTNTVVTKYGPWRVINFINHFLFPAEVFFLVGLTIVMCIHVPPCFIPLMLFAIISYLKMSGWKLGYADRRLVEFKFTYFMNDYYENWLPVFLLIILSVYRHQFVFLLILHLILFPMFIVKLVKDIKTIRENFKTEEDY